MWTINKDHLVSQNILNSVTGNEDIEKAEGSKGGKVVGHTKSGKPIYDNKHANDYKDFSSADHKDAANHHREVAKKIRNHFGSGKDNKGTTAEKEHTERADFHEEASKK